MLRKLLSILTICGLLLLSLLSTTEIASAATAVTNNIFIKNETVTFDFTKDVVVLNGEDITVDNTLSNELIIYADSATTITSFKPRVRIEGVQMRPSVIEFELYFFDDHNYSGYYGAFAFGTSAIGQSLVFIQSTTVTSPIRYALMYYSAGSSTAKYLDFVAGYTYDIRIEIHDDYTYSFYINDTLIIDNVTYSTTELKFFNTFFDIQIPSDADSAHKYHVKISNFKQTYARYLITPTYRKKTIAMVMDDGTVDEYNYSKILINKGYRATISVIAERVGTTDANGYTYSTWDDLKYLRSKGFEIADHTHNHSTLTSLSLLDAKNAILKGKQYIEENITGYTVRTFVPPTGATNVTLDEYASSIGLYDAYLTNREPLTDTTSAYTPYSTYNTFYNLVKNSDKAYVVLYHHASRDINETNFTNLVELCKSEGWMITTFNVYRNIAENVWGATFDNIEFKQNKYKFTAHTNGGVAWVSVYDYFNMGYDYVKVKDVTTGKIISYSKGSYEFFVEDGHTYEIFIDCAEKTMSTAWSQMYIIMTIFIAIVPVVAFLTVLSKAADGIKDIVRRFR